MDDVMLGAFAGAAEGLEKASHTLMNVTLAGQEIKQKKELFGLQKKKAELEIKEAEMLNLDPEVIAAKKEKFKAEADLSKSAFTLNELKIKEAERTARQSVDMHKREMSILHAAMNGKDVVLAPGVSLKTKNLTINGGRQSSPMTYSSMVTEARKRAKAEMGVKALTQEPAAEAVEKHMDALIKKYGNGASITVDQSGEGEFDPQARYAALLDENGGDEDAAYKALAAEIQEKGVSQ